MKGKHYLLLSYNPIECKDCIGEFKVDLLKA